MASATAVIRCWPKNKTTTLIWPKIKWKNHIWIWKIHQKCDDDMIWLNIALKKYNMILQNMNVCGQSDFPASACSLNLYHLDVWNAMKLQ